jgi:hypothetical protein
MSTEDTTPKQHAADETRQITVEVPAHRVAQFERFHQRFLEMATHWDAQVGNEDLRGPRGRRGHRRHGGGPGRCGRRPGAEAAA